MQTTKQQQQRNAEFMEMVESMTHYLAERSKQDAEILAKEFADMRKAGDKESRIAWKAIVEEFISEAKKGVVPEHYMPGPIVSAEFGINEADVAAARERAAKASQKQAAAEELHSKTLKKEAELAEKERAKKERAFIREEVAARKTLDTIEKTEKRLASTMKLLDKKTQQEIKQTLGEFKGGGFHRDETKMIKPKGKSEEVAAAEAIFGKGHGETTKGMGVPEAAELKKYLEALVQVTKDTNSILKSQPKTFAEKLKDLFKSDGKSAASSFAKKFEEQGTDEAALVAGVRGLKKLGGFALAKAKQFAAARAEAKAKEKEKEKENVEEESTEKTEEKPEEQPQPQPQVEPKTIKSQDVLSEIGIKTVDTKKGIRYVATKAYAGGKIGLIKETEAFGAIRTHLEETTGRKVKFPEAIEKKLEEEDLREREAAEKHEADDLSDEEKAEFMTKEESKDKDKEKEEEKGPGLLDTAIDLLGMRGLRGRGPRKPTRKPAAVKPKPKAPVGAVKKEASKGLAKAGGKALGKSLLKKIPGVGLIASLAFGAQRAIAGDWTGAGMEVASGASSLLLGAGTAASVGIDAALAARDMGAFEAVPKERANEIELIEKEKEQIEDMSKEKEKKEQPPIVVTVPSSGTGVGESGRMKLSPRNLDQNPIKTSLEWYSKRTLPA